MPGEDGEMKGDEKTKAQNLAEQKSIRSATKKSISRIKSYVNGKIESMSTTELECRLGLLESYFKQFINIQMNIDKLEDNASDNYREEVEEIYIETKSLLAGRIHELQPQQDGNISFAVPPFPSQPNALYMLKLQKFGGKYSEFPNFIASFDKKVHKNVKFDDLDRFNVLMDHLYGAAKEAIGKYEISAQNYQNVYRQLKARFDNKNLIFSEHISALFDLPKVTKDSGRQLRSLVDGVCSHLGAMLSNGNDTDIAHALIIHLVVQKLDVESRDRWEEAIDYAKLSRWAVLEKRCNHLEAREAKSSVNRDSKNSGYENSYSHPKQKFNRKANTSMVAAPQTPCDYCSNTYHTIHSCTEFRNLSVLDRFAVTKRLSLCIKCLAKGHTVRNCKVAKCSVCSGSHHQLLHRYQNKAGPPSVEVGAHSSPSAQSAGLLVESDPVLSSPTSAVGSRGDTTSLLATAVVYIKDRVGSLQPVRLLLDSGSHINFITTEAVQRLGLSLRKVDQDVSGIGDIVTKVPYSSDAVVYSGCNNFSLAIEMFVLPRITGPQPSSLVDVSGWNIPKNLHLADPNFFEPSKIDLLLGVNYFFSLLSVGQISLGDGLPILQKTMFGWIVSGGGSTSHLASCNFVEMGNEKYAELESLIRRFWEIETMEDKIVKWTEEQSSCETHFLENTVRQSDGRFCVKLPFKANSTLLSSSKLSLNDVMMSGPTVQADLYSIILQFRYGKFALTADITKMYRQILVNSDDTYYQCILWRNNPGEQLKTYRLKTVTYGTSSAPFLATRCLIKLADDCAATHVIGSNVIRSNFYMDDLICSADSEVEVTIIRKETTTILNAAGFQLRKWFTNSPNLLKEIPDADREVPLRINDSDVIKTLGIVWDPMHDRLNYVCPKFPKSSKVTKRTVLSEMSSLFDPLGLINPIVVRAKVFVQELWKLRLHWDESLSLELHNQWELFKNELQHLRSINIPRHLFAPNTTHSIELHGFSDASLTAYGCCIYTRSVDSSGEVVVNLITAKSRVAPINTQSLARLELCGALLLVELLEKVMVTFRKTISNIYLWVDSTVVLDWLAEHPSTWQTFVSNRVAKIQERTVDCQWRHVPTIDNPADIISKGSTVNNLISSIWFTGPEYLKLNPSEWPPTRPNINESQLLMERRNTKFCLSATFIPDSLKHLFARTSKFEKLCRIVAYMLSFVDKLRAKALKCPQTVESPPSAMHRERAFYRIIWNIQQRAFHEDIVDLQSSSKDHKPRSRISSLNPFLECRHGVSLLRVGGRLKNSELPYDAKFPFLMPKDHVVTRMYLHFLHIRNHHVGPQGLVAFSRQQIWIVNAREAAKSVVRRCVTCFKFRPILANQVMGNLPAHRVQIARPFDRVGVDYCGPFRLTHNLRGNRSYKAYVSVFVCFTTKAIHLELVSDLSADAFLAALKRFVARRGKCTHIYSDNATNFIGCRNGLQELRQIVREQQKGGQIAEWCALDGIQFHNIPPNAPHFGGLWESSVKSTKFHLLRTLKNELLTYEEMATVLAEIEAILNSRPICKISQDPNDENALTPGHFLIGGPLNAIPEPIAHNSHVPLQRRWRHINHMKNHFWQRWLHEYIAEMQQRYKWKNRTANVNIGDIVCFKFEPKGATFVVPYINSLYYLSMLKQILQRRRNVESKHIFELYNLYFE